MKLIQILILLTLFIFELSAQVPNCEPAPGGIPATDEPPGCKLCDISYFGTTANYTPDTTVYDFPCGSQENTQWITVVGVRDFFEFELFTFDCNSNQGVEFAVYDNDLNRVSDCLIALPNDFASLQMDNVSGNIFHIMIDGVNGDLCEFEFINLSGPDLFFDFIITPPDAYVCPGKQVCYTIPEWASGQFFEWGRPPNSFVVDGGGQDQNFICVEFTEPGVGTVEIIGESECLLPLNGFLDVTVRLKSSKIDTILCPGDFLKIGNIEYDSTIKTEIPFPIPGDDGCDSIVNLDLRISDISPPEIFCAPDTFLKAISFWWEKPLGAEEYQVFLDDQFITTQDFSSYLFLPDFSKDSIKISIQPLNSFGCDFEKAERMCAIPKISSQRPEHDDFRVKIISNPTGDLVQVESDLKIENIQVFDFSGKEVLFSKEKVIDLSSFSGGIYILKIRTEERLFIKKVIKY